MSHRSLIWSFGIVAFIVSPFSSIHHVVADTTTGLRPADTTSNENQNSPLRQQQQQEPPPLRPLLRRDLQTGNGTIGDYTLPPANIINGTTAAKGDFPWFVLLETGACGGTLISRDRVLTSASCVLSAPKPITNVFVSASTTSNGLQARVECYSVHPDYYTSTASIYNDIAIVKLFDKLNNVQPVKYNKDRSYPSTTSNKRGTTMGFGYSNGEPLKPLSTTLQVVDLNLVPIQDCQAAYPSMGIIGQGQHLCAWSFQRGVCVGRYHVIVHLFMLCMVCLFGHASLSVPAPHSLSQIIITITFL